MQTSASKTKSSPIARLALLLGIGLLVGIVILVVVQVALILKLAHLGPDLTRAMTNLLGADSNQLWWFITRSSALVGYFLLWLSTSWGLVLSSKISDRFLSRAYIYDVHQWISLLGLGFIFLHIIVLTLDRFLPFSWLQILVPFTSSYRPLWVGVGVIAFYLTLLVTVTFYLRKQIGMRAFRAIHVSSLVGYLGATLHGFYAGTDTSLFSVQLLYKGSFLITVFLFVYWLFITLYNRSRRVSPSAQAQTGRPATFLGQQKAAALAPAAHPTAKRHRR